MSMDGSADTATPLVWVRSTHSSNEGGACVEVATTPHSILIRDSKDVTRPHLIVSPARWAHFVRYAAGAG
ncbi:DUF397 domain-containing protein [Streptomyces sp. NPDC057428]|uniref:DUF397 domain-containing protein n=1 Tax=Streptomyces sp. NPDC057428 TaxID=3346129 RepID=UPI0036736F1E